MNQQKYQPIYKPNQLSIGTGKVAIVTGWTPKKQVDKFLEPDEYAAIGQLYSPTRGINFLIRNLIANPHVIFVYCLSATKEDKNSGSVECIMDFFKYGVRQSTSQSGKKVWKINSEVEGYIDIDIPHYVLQSVRRYVHFYGFDNIEYLVKKVKQLHKMSDGFVSWSSPQTFPISNYESTVLPGNIYGHRVDGKTIADTWVKIIHRIRSMGVVRPTGYDGKWQELIDLVAVVSDEPDGFYFPEPNFLPVDREFIQSYIPSMTDDSPCQEGVKYTYGQRMRSHFGVDQVEQVIDKLIKEPDAASAVISIWDTNDHVRGGSPCLNHIWFRVIENELSMTATFRSNDMFSAWCANAMGLRALQKIVRDEIANRTSNDLKMGHLITVSQSAHIYDDCWENADSLIDKQYKRLVNRLNFNDPVGNFLIERCDDDNIIVSQTTPGSGEVVKTFRGINPLKLIREIVASSPSILPEHAAYIGIELQKARNSTKYLQDK